MIKELRIKEDGSPPNHLDLYYKINEIIDYLNRKDETTSVRTPNSTYSGDFYEEHQDNE